MKAVLKVMQLAPGKSDSTAAREGEILLRSFCGYCVSLPGKYSK